MKLTEEQREKYKGLMDYPKGFIDKCLLVYPNDELVKELLEEKSLALLAILEERKLEVISTEEIVEASKNGKMDEIVERAKNIEASKELYKDFSELYDEQYHSKGNYIKDGKVHYNERVFNSYVTRHSLLRNFSNPVLVEKVPEHKPSKTLVAALDYNDARRAAGLTAAENHISD